MSNLFYSMINFILAIFFILIGLICVMIPWSEAIRTDLVQFILDDALVISLFGFAFMVIGIAILINILISTRRQHYVINSGENTVAIDEAVIQQHLSVYWKQLFPKNDIPNRLSLKRNKMIISADLPYLPLNEQKPLLERIKQDLRKIFAKSIGYHEDFLLYISFQNESKRQDDTSA